MNRSISKITIQRLMIRMGISPKSNGYPYLTAAVHWMFLQRPALPTASAVYAEIATMHGVTTASVERCMRFAVGRAFDSSGLELINEMYNASVITEVPTVSEFLYYIVEYLYTFYPYDDISFL